MCSRPHQAKDYKIGICCFSAKHAAVGSRSKDWLSGNRNTVKVLFFVGINFRGLVKNYKFMDLEIHGFCVCTKIKFVDFIFST